MNATSSKTLYVALSGTFKILTIFKDYSLGEVNGMITDASKVKRIDKDDKRITIIWNSDVEWASQTYEYLGYCMFPRPEHLGQGNASISYKLGK